ncbi:MAG: hypothetical protein ACOH1I_10200 [Gallionellaceae bacterium]|jgi:hypothetical protein
MKKLLTIATLAIALPFGAVYAAGMDDMTMQVVDTNDSKDVMNKIEIPDMDKADVADAKHDKKDVDHDAADAKEEATHDAAEEAKEAAHDATEDAKEAKEDSKDVSETAKP